MANCPQCGKHLKIYHWKQDCPFCGVNMVYYKSNERLLEETEKSEIAHAHFQPGVDRAKASTIGSLPAIIRIVLSVLPLGAIMLPLAQVIGIGGEAKSVNAISIYNYVSSVGFGNVFTNAANGDLISISAVCMLISVALIPVAGLFLMKSLGKHGKIINLSFDSVKLLLSIIGAVCFAKANIPTYLPEYTESKIKFGIFVYSGLFLALLIYSLILAKKGLKIKHQPCLIGGIPADEYFKMVDTGASELEIKKKMVEKLTVMQEEFRIKDEQARAKEEAERANWK